MLVAGGGAAAWWFVLRDRGAAYEPQMVIPADEWADGATQVSSSTIAKDATIAASPDGSFLAALSENESSGTGRPPGRKRTLTGYSLADGRASESWRIDTMARIKQNGILGQLLRDSWLAFTEGLL